jgi:hypothetical protein
MSWAKSGESLSQYRSISWAAILAVMLGLASVLAIFNPLLIAVAVAGTGMSLIALRQIAARPDVLSGRGLALTALFLSVFFMIFAPTRLGIRSRVLQQRGQQLADAFLNLLKEGKTYEAHQLSNLRHRSPAQLPDLTADSSKLTTEDLRGFEETEAIKLIKRVENKFSFHLEAVEPTRTYTDMDLFIFRYRLIPEPSTGRKPFPIWVAVSRTLDRGSGTPVWKIVEVQHTFKEGSH